MENLLYAVLIAMAIWVVVGAALCAVGSWGLYRVLVHRGNPSAKMMSILVGLGVFFFVVLGTAASGGAIAGFSLFALLGYAAIALYALGLRNA